MADLYKTLSNGEDTMVEATVSSTGVAEAGDIVALDGTGKLDSSVLPVGVGPDVKLVTVEEAAGLSAGDYVNFFNNAGEKVRLADNSNNREAHGYVLDAFADAATATVFFEGPNTALSALTPGDRIYLGTGGGIISTPLDPSVDAGKTHQYLGTAIDATTVNTDIADVTRL